MVARTFAGEGWEVPQLLTAMWTAPDFYFDRIAQTHMEQWSSGRVALLGDAAYCPSPLSGMGTSLALVGAYVLAGELAMAGDDYLSAFTRYQRAMGEAVTRAQKFAEERTGIPAAKIADAGVDDQQGHAHDGALATESPDVQWCREGSERGHAQGLPGSCGCDARISPLASRSQKRPEKV